MKLSTIVALLKIFEILVWPQFVDSGCTFYIPEMSPYHILFFSSKMKGLHTTRSHFLCRTNFNKTPLMLLLREFQLLTKVSEAAIHRCSFEKVFWKHS